MGIETVAFLRFILFLKPVHLITKNKRLQVIVKAIASSVPIFLKILLTISVFYFFFMMLSMTLFFGKFYHCRLDNLGGASITEVQNKWDCLNVGGVWVLQYPNYDNLLNSYVSTMVLMTTEGWQNLLLLGVSSTKVNYVPEQNNNFWYSLVFILQIFVCSFFFLNLIVGVVLSNFKVQKNFHKRTHLLTKTQKEWIQIQSMIYKSKPLHGALLTDSRIRNFFIKVADHPKFEKVILGFIFGYTFILCVKWYGMSENIEFGTKIINYVFAGIFVGEAAIKIIAYKKRYFKDGWNKFDFVVALGSILGAAIGESADVGFGVQTMLIRTIRIGRVFKLVKESRRLNLIFLSFINSLSSLLGVTGLLFFLIYIYAVVGMQIFAEVKLHGSLNEHVNFQSFLNAFFTLMQIMTGEKWYEVMYDLAS